MKRRLDDMSLDEVDRMRGKSTRRNYKYWIIQSLINIPKNWNINYIIYVMDLVIYILTWTLKISLNN